MHRVAVVIQARMGSSRLPGKVLKPLRDSVVLDYVVQRCARSGAHDVIVATTSAPADDRVAEHCERKGYTSVRGSEEDVLSRFVAAADRTRAEIIVRVTADCPAIAPEVIDQLVGVLEQTNADYVHVKAEEKYPDALPRGLNTEVFWRRTLDRLAQGASEPRHREHVTLQVEERGDYVLVRVPAPPELARPRYRLTLDVDADYQMLSRLFEECPVGVETPIAAIIGFLDAHPEIVSINAGVEQKSSSV